MRWETRVLRAVGIGAVFTPQALRGRGYASALLGTLLDAERAAGTDVAFLFSDIAAAFYEQLGFHALPSRAIAVRAGSLDGSPVGAAPLGQSDWVGVRACFDALEQRRAWSFVRTPLVWDWMRSLWSAPGAAGSQAVQLGVREGRSICAYVVGRRVPRADTFALTELGFRNEVARSLVGPLLRAAAGDLARIAGWLPPEPARSALPRGTVTPRRDAIFMVAPLSAQSHAWWKATASPALGAHADPAWSADHV